MGTYLVNHYRVRLLAERSENGLSPYTQPFPPRGESRSCDKIAALSASVSGSFRKSSLLHPFRDS
jgi:hypothetical protein